MTSILTTIAIVAPMGSVSVEIPRSGDIKWEICSGKRKDNIIVKFCKETTQKKDR